MKTFCNVAVVGAMSVLVNVTWAQGQAQNDSNREELVVEDDSPHIATYVSISDIEGPDYESGPIAFESLSDYDDASSNDFTETALANLVKARPPKRRCLTHSHLPSRGCGN